MDNTQVLNIDPGIDLKQCLLWQYNNSQALRDLLNAKQNWYTQNHAQFWQNWYDNVFNINTADDFGLAVWGQILKFSRNVTAKDGTLHYLTREQYRLILKGQMIKFGMGASAYDVNKWISIVFAGKGNAYCVDSYDMTAIPIVFRAVPDEEIGWLLGNIDFFPRPAGVGYEVRVIPDTVFGFNGSHLKPFNQGVFQNDYSEILQPPATDSYQFSISAPQDATVLINGEEKRYAILEDGTEYTWSVTKDGYLGVSGSGTVTGTDVSIGISSFTVTDTSGLGTVFINNQTARGAYFQTGTSFAYSYSVGADGYIPASGSGTATQDYSLSTSALTINTTPANATVELNGQTAKGAFFVTGSIFNYTYTVSAAEYQTQSGNGSVTENNTINVTLVHLEYNYSQSNIRTPDLTQNVQTLFEQQLPFEGNYTITLAAGAGWSGSVNTWKAGGISYISGTFTNDQTVKIVAIKGGYTSAHTRYGGCGIGLYVNNTLVAVSGGGGTFYGNAPYAGTSGISYGGGGYIGGDCTTSRTLLPGYSIDSTVGNSTLVSQGASGAAYPLASYAYYAYGGSSYANSNLGYSISQVYGNGNIQGNVGNAYFTITLNV